MPLGWNCGAVHFVWVNKGALLRWDLADNLQTIAPVKRSLEQQAQQPIYFPWRLAVIKLEQRLSMNASSLEIGGYHGRIPPVGPGLQVEAYQSMYVAWGLVVRHPRAAGKRRRKNEMPETTRLVFGIELIECTRPKSSVFNVLIKFKHGDHRERLCPCHMLSVSSSG